jgi:hypothetical protein
MGAREQHRTVVLRCIGWFFCLETGCWCDFRYHRSQYCRFPHVYVGGMYVSTSSYWNGVGVHCDVAIPSSTLVLGSKIYQSPIATAKPVCSAPGYMRPVRCNAPEVSTLVRLRSWPLGGASRNDSCETLKDRLRASHLGVIKAAID